ncbi:hypothetical protein PFISCL1PPCAC_28128 [Pristionchus fissidentatus]|uniref:G protein-coupled receptor n=1 Tax=Pristionchus fissidentatus TaxID=1538716 RepID=A0AAV5X077_9BILA|nr:hypothetical protein PFISCL1PPCAC_28128 [Pristionchus fissidentatus]
MRLERQYRRELQGFFLPRTREVHYQRSVEFGERPYQPPDPNPRQYGHFREKEIWTSFMKKMPENLPRRVWRLFVIICSALLLIVVFHRNRETFEQFDREFKTKMPFEKTAVGLICTLILLGFLSFVNSLSLFDHTLMVVMICYLSYIFGQGVVAYEHAVHIFNSDICEVNYRNKMLHQFGMATFNSTFNVFMVLTIIWRSMAWQPLIWHTIVWTGMITNMLLVNGFHLYKHGPMSAVPCLAHAPVVIIVLCFIGKYRILSDLRTARAIPGEAQYKVESMAVMLERVMLMAFLTSLASSERPILGDMYRYQLFVQQGLCGLYLIFMLRASPSAWNAGFFFVFGTFTSSMFPNFLMNFLEKSDLAARGNATACLGPTFVHA